MVIKSSQIWCNYCHKFIAFDTEKNLLVGDHNILHFCKCNNELIHKDDI